MSLATEETIWLSFKNAADWSFVNRPWLQDADGTIRTPDAQQDFYHAFYTHAAFDDFEARFKFRIDSANCDVGLIFAARDPLHFHVLHFPNCGQQNRAQHVWATISRMDGDGYLRCLHMDLVRRVPSNLGIWHDVRFRVEGDLASLWVNDYPVFTRPMEAPVSPGHIGLRGFQPVSLKDISITGQSVAPRWDSSKVAPDNYFIPVPDETFGKWQGGARLTRAPSGDLLMSFYTGSPKVGVIARSRDNGRSWSKPWSMPDVKGDGFPMTPLVLRDGRLIALRAAASQVWRAESLDDGQSWSEPTLAETGPFPADPPKLSSHGLIELKDGTLLMFLLGVHSSTGQRKVHTWGAYACQTFCIRSTDGGRSWSAPVNIDSNPNPHGAEGNLDLTETAAIETTDGKILALTRPIYSPWVWESGSHDGGRSWGPTVRGPLPAKYSPSNMIRTACGALVFGARYPGTVVHTSFDEGKTWDNGTIIDTAIWALGGMIEIEPDLVLFVYMDSFQGPMRGQFFRVTRDGIRRVPER